MEVRTILTLVLAAALSFGLSLLSFVSLEPAWWQIAIIAVLVAFVAIKVSVGRIVNFFAFASALALAFLINERPTGQGFWADMIVWGAAAGLLAALLMSLWPAPHSATSTTTHGHGPGH